MSLWPSPPGSAAALQGSRLDVFGFQGQQVPKARSLSPFSSRFAVEQSARSWCSQGCQAIVDTGTFLLTVPQEYIESILEALGAQETSFGVSGGIWEGLQQRVNQSPGLDRVPQNSAQGLQV